MIDLSQFVGKDVLVTFRSGVKTEGNIILDSNYLITPYIFFYSVGNMSHHRSFSRNGLYYFSAQLDIIRIEEIKTMKTYEQLENKVAEMQKEIERLKREEKNYPKLKPVEITRTVQFTPEEYFKFCEECEIEPSERGYVEYYSEPDELDGCFSDSKLYSQKIKEVKA
jgi:hypothetical protein